MRTVLVVLLLLFSTLFHSLHLGGSVVFPSLKSQLLLQFYTRMLLDVISLVPLWMPPPCRDDARTHPNRKMGGGVPHC